jgi:hypothetical protein
MTAIAREHTDNAEFNNMIPAHTPAVRWGESDEVAGAAACGDGLTHSLGGALQTRRRAGDLCGELYEHR